MGHPPKGERANGRADGVIRSGAAGVILTRPTAAHLMTLHQHSGAGSFVMTTELARLSETNRHEEDVIKEGGGGAAQERLRNRGRLPARERIARLLDADTDFLELGLWAAWQMYGEWGGAPSAGVVTGVGRVEGRCCMFIANDATV